VEQRFRYVSDDAKRCAGRYRTDRYSKADPKYLKNFIPHHPSKYMTYVDANNLYGWSAVPKAPCGGLTWLRTTHASPELVLNLPNDGGGRGFFSVELEIPKDEEWQDEFKGYANDVRLPK
jgi:hypothetical protein